MNICVHHAHYVSVLWQGISESKQSSLGILEIQKQVNFCLCMTDRTAGIRI